MVSFLYTGSAMATTAIGTLIPILRDNGELKTRFGTYLLAADGRVRPDAAGDAGALDHQPAAQVGLVGAAMLSTPIYPFVGTALRKDALEEELQRPEPSRPFPAGEGPLPRPGLVG